MRIAFVIDNLNIGGTELNAVRTAEALRERDIDLVLLSLQQDGPLLSRYQAAGIAVHAFPVNNLYGPTAWRQATRLASLLRNNRIEVLHAHDIYTNVFAVPVARAVGVPLTIASRRWWYPPARGYRMANRVAYRTAHRVVTNSTTLAELVTRVEGIPQRRIHVIPNFLEPASFQRPPVTTLGAWFAELDLPPEAVVIGCVANLLPVKDHATLLRGFAELFHGGCSAAHLVLVGDGECRGELEQLAGELGIRDHVRFAGRRPSHPSFHHFFDISALTSTSEGSPNTILEAMAAGRPVIATKVGAIGDLIDANVGLLVPPSDPSELSRALRVLIEAPHLRDQLGTAARARARRSHLRDGVIDGLIELYEAGVTAASPS